MDRSRIVTGRHDMEKQQQARTFTNNRIEHDLTTVLSEIKALAVERLPDPATGSPKSPLP